MFSSIGTGELVLILVIVLLLFGSKRVPEVAKSLGRSIKAFKDGMKDIHDNTDDKIEKK